MSKILVIEDEDAVRENLHELLELEGHAVFSTSDGRSGIELVRQHRPDLIICDIQMPEMNGYQVLEALGETPSAGAIPFIFLTAKTSRSDMRTGMALGADDYITKPFTHDEVLEAIASRLKKQSTLAQQYKGQMDELRQKVAQMLPHELRTPLTVILGYSSLLLESDGVLPLAELKEIAGSIFHAGERLERLIQRFLLYVELDPARQNAEGSGATQRHGPLMLTQLTRHLAQAIAQKTDRSADLRLDAEDCVVHGSDSYLAAMLTELIENAFKFSETGTPVQVSIREVDNAAHISITDQGRGMTQEQIAQVGAYMQFERRRFEQQGRGLGLVLARHITELHGGEMSIESIPAGYTAVHVRLPNSTNGQS